jgi:hypothetical protein
VLAGDVGTELLESIDEVCDGALAHAFDSIEQVAAVTEGAEGSQKADAGAAVFEPKFGRLGGNVSGETVDGTGAVLEVLLDDESESPEAFNHDSGVLAVKNAGEAGGTVCEGSEQESAVGDAF